MAMAIGRQSSDFTNIQLTMLGGLVNGITFCGMVDAPGINYDACPTFGSCEQDALWKKSAQYVSIIKLTLLRTLNLCIPRDVQCAYKGTLLYPNVTKLTLPGNHFLHLGEEWQTFVSAKDVVLQLGRG